MTTTPNSSNKSATNQAVKPQKKKLTDFQEGYRRGYMAALHHMTHLNKSQGGVLC